MDLCAWHPSIRVMVEDGLSVDEVDRRLGYTTTSGRMILEIAADLRREVGQALRATFGAANVNGGNKAFRVSAVRRSEARRSLFASPPSVRRVDMRRGS